MSRHHHVTVLAAAWWVTQDERYADAAAEQLRSWWSANPFLTGVHWTSGIEAGVRLISWTWIRRLLDDWPKVGDLFEHNDDAVRQIFWHQEFLAGFPSRGSSANNHVLAEAAGQLVAACAFPWYSRSAGWRQSASALLERELAANTFDDGVNREQASDYHRFVLELGLVAAVEADAHDHALSESTWQHLARMLDAAAAVVDVTGRPPRQGDGDEGRAVVLDDPDRDPWAAALATGAAVLGAAPWWPAVRRRRSGEIHRCSRAAPPATPSGGPAPPLRGRGPGAAALDDRRRPGDLVPVRQRPARFPVHRGPRPRRCALAGGAARRGRHPRRSRHLLLSRRAGMAPVVPFDGGPQHRGDRWRQPVRLRGTVPVEDPGPDHDPDL